MQRKGGIHKKFVVTQPLKSAVLRVEFIVNRSHQLFQHVIQRDHANGASEFIDHQSKVSMLIKEKLKQLVQRHQFRYRMQRAGNGAQIRSRTVNEGQQVLDVDHTQSALKVSINQGKASMLGIQRSLQVLGKVPVDLESDDGRSRGHNVAHNMLAQLQRIDQNVALSLGHF